MTFNLNREKKIKIAKGLIANPSVFYGSHDEGIIDLLDHVFNLRTKPSEDSRYKDAYGDAVKHLVHNNDWELEYTLLTRFDVTEGDKLVKLLEYLVSPGFQPSEPQRLNLADEINFQLNKEGFSLDTSGFDNDDNPIFELSNYDPNNKYPTGVVKNNIRFFPNYEVKDLNEFKPEEKDIFILDFRDFDWWNDYSLKSRCNLVYRDSDGELDKFGELKIITNDSSNYSEHQDKDGNFQNFHPILPESFTELDDSFCSLGQSKAYYEYLKEEYKAKFRSILFALRDAAFFTDISDIFERESYFKNSLIREDKAERILREVRFELSGRTRADMYTFTHLFSPKFGDAEIPPIRINFDFEDTSEIPNRICAIIGKNGVGKTQFISQLPRDLAEENDEFFDSATPLFSKIIALSYSPFDTFKPSKSGINIDYTFCSLRDETGDMGDDRGRAIKFGHTRKRIEELERVEDWEEILSEFLPESYLLGIFGRDDLGKPKVNIEKLNSMRRELSSGQRILLETVTNIIAHIRYDSLLLFDEPETHLHPNAIAQLMNTIYELVKRFQSFCILTTHSPIIIRELLSRNVYVFDRVEDSLAIRKIGLESFGANLSDITEEVFGTNEIPKHYQEIIRRLKRKEKNADEIIEAIQSDNIPVSLNLRLFVNSIFEESE
ncbi:MAG: AAA family ATPase [Reichenbachiella sp.]|uniref:AbiJ-related protein n=1 Tax=Reichenbachiella sp. TaxID=2184521 RepID=UPI002966768B|nr:AAA family ATPase [Reichenbachiella sp.]MDW3210289.1 AAA family ATPase [Reichenbachiella sp.]